MTVMSPPLHFRQLVEAGPLVVHQVDDPFFIWSTRVFLPTDWDLSGISLPMKLRGKEQGT
jgi:hypothetical protein